jgi:hypothetical protein
LVREGFWHAVAPQPILGLLALTLTKERRGLVMATCECLARCPFFHDEMADMPSTTMLLKARYCDGDGADSLRCARHMVFAAMGRDAVPTDLYPSDVDRAEQVIAG